MISAHDGIVCAEVTDLADLKSRAVLLPPIWMLSCCIHSSAQNPGYARLTMQWITDNWGRMDIEYRSAIQEIARSYVIHDNVYRMQIYREPKIQPLGSDEDVLLWHNVLNLKLAV